MACACVLATNSHVVQLPSSLTTWRMQQVRLPLMTANKCNVHSAQQTLIVPITATAKYASNCPSYITSLCEWLPARKAEHTGILTKMKLAPCKSIACHSIALSKHPGHVRLTVLFRH
eukprot:GHRR01001126.1.p1 GENE.GHRR01001126.1~~GHRR01001126.1.p1  ORF type:complete len:117 (+),score=21.37 GHRR01001126.1:1230-1580(+)